MTVATILLEVNWNGDGATFVDETANLIRLKCQRGRDYASALTGRVQAGTLEAVMHNKSQRYSPFNASSPLYGNLIPGRKVRLRATNPVARVLWSGFLSDPNPDAEERLSPGLFVLSAQGPLWWIAEQESSTALEASIDSGAAVGKVLDDAGWPAADRLIDTGHLTLVNWKADMQGARTDPRKAITHLQELEEAEMGLLSESADGKIVFEETLHRLKSPHTTSQATFSDASGAALPYDLIRQLSPWRQIFNRFTAEVAPTVDNSPGTLWSLGEKPVLNPGVSRTFTAVWPAPGSRNGSAFVKSWNAPTLTANSQVDGLGTDLTAQIGVTTVKGANTMQITLVNNASVPAYIVQLFATGTTSDRSDTVVMQAVDQASIAKYGKRTYALGSRFYPTTERAQQFCDWGVSRYAQPQPIVAIEFEAGQSSEHMTQALTRDISDRITLRANGTTPAGGQLGILADFFIETVVYEYDLRRLVTTYRLSYAGDASNMGDGGYWTLGISTLGETTRLVIP